MDTTKHFRMFRMYRTVKELPYQQINSTKLRNSAVEELYYTSTLLTSYVTGDFLPASSFSVSFQSLLTLIALKKVNCYEFYSFRVLNVVHTT